MTRHGVPVALAAHDAARGDAVRPSDSERRRVGVLDDVVLGLGAARVAGQAALGAQPGEVVPAGEQLVHVGLVPGVEDHGVARRVEDPVDGDGELDDAEVGPEVAPGARDLLDEEAPDLLARGPASGPGAGTCRSSGPSMRSSRLTGAYLPGRVRRTKPPESRRIARERRGRPLAGSPPDPHRHLHTRATAAPTTGTSRRATPRRGCGNAPAPRRAAASRRRRAA